LRRKKKLARKGYAILLTPLVGAILVFALLPEKRLITPEMRRHKARLAAEAMTPAALPPKKAAKPARRRAPAPEKTVVKALPEPASDPFADIRSESLRDAPAPAPVEPRRVEAPAEPAPVEKAPVEKAEPEKKRERPKHWCRKLKRRDKEKMPDMFCRRFNEDGTWNW
jgi:hypothetical protein